MHSLRIIAAAAVAASVANGSVAAETTVLNAEGARLQVLVDLPSGQGRFPAIVLAPGQGYHMTLPAMEATTRALVAQGIAVFRFNWAYFTSEPKGQPSNDLSKELRDLQAVIAAARQHPNVAPERLSVGGKSLGSVVAWRALAADPKLRSGLLLTPICSHVPKGESNPKSVATENYPEFESERRPTLWISGDRDPLCAPSVLYQFAATSTAVARVAIVGGDHGYENPALPPPEADATRKRNLAAVSTVAASFIAGPSDVQP